MCWGNVMLEGMKIEQTVLDNKPEHSRQFVNIYDPR